MRFDFPNPLRSNQFESGNSVCCPPFIKSLQPRQFILSSRHNQFPAAIVADPILFAELHHEASTFHAELRLIGSRFVINACVNDSAVVARLVIRQLRLLFQYGQRVLRKLRFQGKCRRKPYDTPADYDYVVLFRIHATSLNFGDRHHNTLIEVNYSPTDSFRQLRNYGACHQNSSSPKFILIVAIVRR